MIDQFLDAVLGPRGANIISGLFKSESAKTAVLHRTIMAWLEPKDHFSGVLPGTEIQTILTKSGGTWSGVVPSDVNNPAFSNATATRAAALIAMALGATRDLPDHGLNMVRLGPTLDLLVKTQFKPHEDGAPDAPDERLALTPPTPPGSVQRKPRLPKIRRGAMPPKSVTFSKSESAHKCRICAAPQFKEARFAGCFCLRGLAKSVVTVPTESGFLVNLGPKWTATDFKILEDTLHNV